MSDDPIVRLLENLIRKTRNEEVQWNPSEEFASAYEVETSQAVILSASRDGDGAPPYEFEIRNKDNEILESLVQEASRGPYERHVAGMIGELYELARRQALGVNKIIDSVFDELDINQK